MQYEVNGGVAVETMRILSFDGSNFFNQSDSKNSLWIIKYEAVVLWLKALIGSLQGLTLNFLQSEAFNLCTTQSVRKINLNSPYARIFN